MPPDETRKIIAPHLLLAELARDPESFDKWVEDNLLTRALAHLVARCGDSSVFLRALASGVLRVAVESAGGVAEIISAAGRTGVTIHDASVDARTVAVDADGQASAVLMSRDASLDALIAYPGHGGRGPQGQTEHEHAGGGVETHDFTNSACRALVITVDAGPVKVYRSVVSGATETPMGIANVYYPLLAATEERYLDMDASAATTIHILAFFVDQLS